MTFTEDLLHVIEFNFPSKIAENFRVVLTKYVRIATDVFIKRVFKGNTVTDRDSSASQCTQIVGSVGFCRESRVEGRG